MKFTIDWGKVVSSKTNWVAALVIISGIVEYFAGLPKGTPIAQIILGVVMIALRFLTSDSLTNPPIMPPKGRVVT